MICIATAILILLATGATLYVVHDSRVSQKMNEAITLDRSFGSVYDSLIAKSNRYAIEAGINWSLPTYGKSNEPELTVNVYGVSRTEASECIEILELSPNVVYLAEIGAFTKLDENEFRLTVEGFPNSTGAAQVKLGRRVVVPSVRYESGEWAELDNLDDWRGHTAMRSRDSARIQKPSDLLKLTVTADKFGVVDSTWCTVEPVPTFAAHFFSRRVWQGAVLYWEKSSSPRTVRFLFWQGDGQKRDQRTVDAGSLHD